MQTGPRHGEAIARFAAIAPNSTERKGEAMSRTTSDLVRELHSEAAKFTKLQLVVGFEDFCEFINAEDLNALKNLNEAVNRGGEPIGLIGTVIGENCVQIYSRCVEEYCTEKWAADFLDRVTREKAASIPGATLSPGNWQLN
jgi:hypothetical protein